MDAHTSPSVETKSVPAVATTTTADPSTSNTNMEHAESRDVIPANTPLPPSPPVATSPSAPAPSPAATVQDDGVVTTQPPPAYMAADPNAKVVKTANGVPVLLGAPIPRPENYVIPLQQLKEEPDFVDCPHCHSRQKTKVTHEPSSQTSMAALFCCLCCGILPAIIPFCCNWCADVDHICTHCNRTVAHQPYEGKMEPVLPRPAQVYQPSQFQTSQFQPATGTAPAPAQAGTS